MKVVLLALALAAHTIECGATLLSIESNESGLFSPASCEVVKRKYPIETEHRWLNKATLRADLASGTLAQDIERVLHPQLVEATLPTGAVIKGFFVDQGSDRLIVVGGGFPVILEKLVPLTVLLGKSNYLFFNYRGVGDSGVPLSWLNPFHVMRKSVKSCFAFDPGVTTYGQHEDEDLLAIVYELSKKKVHRQVVGYASCYSASIFAHAVARKPDLFSHLIIEGVWPSFDQVIEQCIANPSLLVGRQPPSSPLPCLTHSRAFQAVVKWIVGASISLPARPARLEDLFPKLPPSLPVLFMQAQNDCYCTPVEYERLWHLVPGKAWSALFCCDHARTYFSAPHSFGALAQAFYNNDLEPATPSRGMKSVATMSSLPRLETVASGGSVALQRPGASGPVFHIGPPPQDS